MSTNHFIVKSVKALDDLKEGDRIDESDFAAMTPSGKFVQLKYMEEEVEVKPFICRPGVWSIQKTMRGMTLDKTSFTKDMILDDFVHTKHITDKIDCFFTRLHIYREHGFEVPKRAMLLFGVPGTGKTTSAIKAAQKYADDGRTAVLVWGTDKIDPMEVKDFVKAFKYENVDKMILIMEDIGGVEIDQVRMKSTSSLLSLLDNQEKTFAIPIFIIATTNHPENFLGSLTNRPGRFDDKIEVGYPSADARVKLLEFFNKGKLSEDVVEKFELKKYEEFSPAHIKEIVIRAAIYDMTLIASIDSILKEIEHYKKAFTKTKKLGIGHDDFDD